jgi:hypothetical protein
MANPRLTTEQLALANGLLKLIREQLDTLCDGDSDLRFALNRKIAKELAYDERSKPMVRRKLKIKKRVDQGNKCPECNSELPISGAVLDRFRAIDGYTVENTRLICQSCDNKIQASRGYA